MRLPPQSFSKERMSISCITSASLLDCSPKVLFNHGDESDDGLHMQLLQWAGMTAAEMTTRIRSRVMVCTCSAEHRAFQLDRNTHQLVAKVDIDSQTGFHLNHLLVSWFVCHVCFFKPGVFCSQCLDFMAGSPVSDFPLASVFYR